MRRARIARSVGLRAIDDAALISYPAVIGRR
jgi:hypothetical protein